MTDTFAYLSVLLSIVLGLAMAEVLQGYGVLLLARSRLRLYGPPLIWSLMMLMMAAQFWWASFGLRKVNDWSFAAFCAVLLQTVMLYMGTSVVLPKSGSEPHIDLRAHYYREAKPFFSFGLLFILVGFAKDWLIDAFPRPAWTLAFFGFFASVTIIGLLTRRPRVHETIAPLMAFGIVLFFALMFWRL